MKAKAKVLVIGLDSAEPALLERWMRSGDLPVLAALHARGLWGKATNTPGFGNGVYWPSFATGVNPGRTGRYFMYQIKPGSYDVGLFDDDRELKVEPFWRTLDRAGKRVAAIDMFRLPLTDSQNGMVVVDWTAHSPAHPPRSSPPGLISEVLDLFGPDPLAGDCDAYGPAPEEYEKLFRELLVRVNTKTRMSAHYLARGDWDLFMTVFAEAHDIGHRAWHLHDTNHVLHDPELVRTLGGDPVKIVYRELDKAVGKLIEAAGPDATVFILTGLGIEPDYTANHLIEDILLRLEGRPTTENRRKPDPIRSLYHSIVPTFLRQRVRNVAHQAGWPLSHDDRAMRRFFALPHDENSGAIRINLAGREPNGLVQPGAEFDACCKTLTQDLLEITNVEAGEPVVSEVVRVAEFCHGDHVDDLPDLFAVWHRPQPITVVASPKIGEIRRPYPGTRTGDHNTNGTFVACGPTIGAGVLDNPVPVTALAPSIAALLGVALPGAEEAPIPAIAG